jgi:replicative DNA helicase
MDPRSGGRQVPHDVDAEAAVLGAVLIDHNAFHEISGFLLPDHFYVPAHRVIYETMIELREEDRPIDPVMLRARLEEKGALERAGGVEALVEILDVVPSAANVRHYAEIVRDKGVVRNLIQTAAAIIESAHEWTGEAVKLVDEAEGQIFQLSQTGAEREAGELGVILREEAWPLIDALHDDKAEKVGAETGFYALDDLLAGGFHPGELVIVAARPSMGKTSFALNCALNYASTTRKPALLFSLEVSRAQVAMNMLCMDARLDVSAIRKGQLSGAQIRDALDASDRLQELQVFVIDEPNLGIYQLRAKARRLKHRYPELGMVMVDYLQLMEGSSRGGRGPENRQQEISEISRGLKGLARELGIPVVALSQLNRSVDQREGHRPRMSDLRESGAIEQDADVIMFLYREEYYNKSTNRTGLADVIVAKQRNGPTGDIELRFSGQYMRFDNVSYQSDPLEAI